jgi:hypothetical protein
VTDGAMLPSGVPDLAAAAARTIAIRADYAAGHAGALEVLETHATWLDYVARWSAGVDQYKAGLLAGDAAQTVALIKYKAMDYVGARWWAERVQAMAERISDTDLTAVGLVRRAMVSIGQGRGQGAVFMMSRALEIGVTPHARALVDIHLARALSVRAAGEGAQGDDVDQALRALDRAAVAIDQAEREGRPRPAYASSFGEAWMDYHRGDVLARHRPKQANILLISAGQKLGADRQTKGSVQVRLAEVAEELGETERAVGVAVNALTIVAPGGAWREVNRVARLHDRLAAKYPSRVLHPLEHALSPHRKRWVYGSTSWRADHRRQL